MVAAAQPPALDCAATLPKGLGVRGQQRTLLHSAAVAASWPETALVLAPALVCTGGGPGWPTPESLATAAATCGDLRRPAATEPPPAHCLGIVEEGVRIRRVHLKARRLPGALRSHPGKSLIILYIDKPIYIVLCSEACAPTSELPERPGEPRVGQSVKRCTASWPPR